MTSHPTTSESMSIIHILTDHNATNNPFFITISMDFTLRDILVAGGLVGLGFFSHKVLRSVSCWTQKKRIPDDHCVKVWVLFDA